MDHARGYRVYDPGRDAEDHARAIAEAFATSTDGIPAWVEQVGADFIRVIEVDGRFAAASILLPMGQFFGGRAVPMVGLAGVTVRPEYRGRGLGRTLMEESVREMAPMAPISTLYPSTQPLYRSVGYEVAGTLPSIELELTRIPRGRHALHLSRLDAAANAALPKALDAHATRDLRDLYRDLAPARNGHLDRGDYIWNRILRSRLGPVRTFQFHDQEHKLRGWIALRQVTQQQERHAIEVMGLEAADAEAMTALLDFLGGYGAMAESVTLPLAPHHPLVLALPETRGAMRVRELWMTRILDLPGAIAARGFPAGLELEFSVHLDDPLLPANQGDFLLRLSGGRGHCERLNEAGSSPPLRADVRGMAALYTAFASAEELARRGLIEGPPEALALATMAFAGPSPWCPDMF